MLYNSKNDSHRIMHRIVAFVKIIKLKSERCSQPWMQTHDGSKIIINFPTKATWNRPSEYLYIEMAFKSLHDEIIIATIAVQRKFLKHDLN